ncbi:MAG TPA: hypothetical protein VJI13_05375 [Candidatus Norongarragalinales archaeon]|nr:hypothetical protein [Candidatus Norongarragalinales archaeon]
MARGQAFETMMLVISVIVALAILGVLLNILGIFGGGVIGGKPLSIIKDGLRDLHSRGYGTNTPQKITFEKGEELRRGELVTDLPVSARDIVFKCAGEADDICGNGDDAPLAITNDNTITASKKMDVMVVTCANEQRDDPPYYCVVITSVQKPGSATETCVEVCGIDE